MNSTATHKAAAAFLTGRVTVVKCTPDTLTLECKSSRGEARYLASVTRDELGVIRSCSCPNGLHHPVRPRCWHVAACELLAGLEDGSAR